MLLSYSSGCCRVIKCNSSPYQGTERPTRPCAFRRSSLFGSLNFCPDCSVSCSGTNTGGGSRWQNCSFSVIPVLLDSRSSLVSFLLHAVQPTSSATLLHHPVTRVWAQVSDEVDKHKAHRSPSLTSRVTSSPEETEGASGPQALHPPAGHAAPARSGAPGEGSLSITIPPASHKALSI